MGLPIQLISTNKSGKWDQHDKSEKKRNQNEKEHEVPMAGRLEKPDLKKYTRKNKITMTMPYQSSFPDPRSNPDSGNNPSITLRDILIFLLLFVKVLGNVPNIYPISICFV